jgi:hypothetical protein
VSPTGKRKTRRPRSSWSEETQVEMGKTVYKNVGGDYVRLSSKCWKLKIKTALWSFSLQKHLLVFVLGRGAPKYWAPQVEENC